MKTITRVSTILLLAVSVLAACSPAATPTPTLTSITVQLKWVHQAQFAGFYVAAQNGYYAEEGLAVNFLAGGPEVDVLKPVLEGVAAFGVASADALILAWAEGKPLRAIATIYRRNPLVFFALADSGIAGPQDFVGKAIHASAFQLPLLHAMTTCVGISSDQYRVVTRDDFLTALYSGEVQVVEAYLTNEVRTAQAAGYKINIIYPDDYGVHFYADTIFTTDDTIAKNPDLVVRFLRATLKAWTYAVEHPAEIGPVVAKYKPDANLEHETAYLTSSLPLINTGEDYIGWMKPEVWTGMEQTLREQDVLTQTLDVTQVYTMQFLKEIYGK